MISSTDLTTDRFHSHHAAPGTEWRAAAAYLWLGLPLMFFVRLALPLAGYAGVCLAVALRRCKNIGAATARVGGVLSLALTALIVFGRLFLSFPPVRIAWAVATIPFIAYVLPYVLGAAIARRSVHAPGENLSPNTA